MDDPDRYPLYFIWDGVKSRLLGSIGFVCAVIGYSVITVVGMATASLKSSEDSRGS